MARDTYKLMLWAVSVFESVYHTRRSAEEMGLLARVWQQVLEPWLQFDEAKDAMARVCVEYLERSDRFPTPRDLIPALARLEPNRRKDEEPERGASRPAWARKMAALYGRGSTPAQRADARAWLDEQHNRLEAGGM